MLIGHHVNATSLDAEAFRTFHSDTIRRYIDHVADQYLQTVAGVNISVSRTHDCLVARIGVNLGCLNLC